MFDVLLIEVSYGRTQIVNDGNAHGCYRDSKAKLGCWRVEEVRNFAKLIC